MQTEILNVTGMTCSACTSEITRALVAVDGVNDVHVSLPKNEVIVQYDEQFTSSDKLKLAIRTAGYGIADEAKSSEAADRNNCCG